MKKNLLLSLVLLAVLVNSCQSPKDTFKIVEFVESVSLVKTEIDVAGVLSNPTDILFLNDVIVVNDQKSEYILHFFDNAQFEHLVSLVKRGRGPSEELMIQYVTQLSSDQFLYKTLNDLKWLKFDKMNSSLTVLESIEVPIEHLIVAYPLAEGRILGWNYDLHQTEFLLYNPLDESFKDFGGAFPNIGESFSLEEKHQLFGNKQITVKPDKSKFAAAYMAFPFLRIFDAESGEVKSELTTRVSSTFPEAIISSNATQEDVKNLIENYYKIVSTDSFIYALYSGKTKGELYPDLFSQSFSVPDFGNEIHVWNWSGEPVRKIILDQLVFSFDVCNYDSRLIAFSVNEPDKLFLYELP